MSVIFKTIAAVAVFSVIVVAAGVCWLYFYSSDLPDIAGLVGFAPQANATVADACSKRAVNVIPFASLGKNVRDATLAAEGESNKILAVQISRNLFCDSRTKMLKRHLIRDLAPNSRIRCDR